MSQPVAPGQRCLPEHFKAADVASTAARESSLCQPAWHHPSGALVMFLHIHKAMGITMCALADNNVDNVALNNNCLMPPFASHLSPNALVSPFHHDNLCPFSSLSATGVSEVAMRAKAVGENLTRRVGFIAAEGAMPSAVPLDAPVVWLTILREPADRLVSAFGWYLRFPVFRQADSRCSGNYPIVNSSTGHALGPEEWLVSYPPNMMARSLCGANSLFTRGPSARAVFASIDMRAANAGLFRCAQQRLRIFAVVGILEHPHETQKVMAEVLGWVNFRSLYEHHNKAPKSEELTAAENKLRQRLASDEHLLAVDSQVYKTAKDALLLRAG